MKYHYAEEVPQIPRQVPSAESLDLNEFIHNPISGSGESLQVGELRKRGAEVVIRLLSITYGLEKSRLIDKLAPNNNANDGVINSKSKAPIDTAVRAFKVIMSSKGEYMSLRQYFRVIGGEN